MKSIGRVRFAVSFAESATPPSVYTACSRVSLVPSLASPPIDHGYPMLQAQPADSRFLESKGGDCDTFTGLRSTPLRQLAKTHCFRSHPPCSLLLDARRASRALARRPRLGNSSSVHPRLDRSTAGPSPAVASRQAMPTVKRSKCCVCGGPATNRCGACAKSGVSLLFCSPEHLKLVRAFLWSSTVRGAG